MNVSVRRLITLAFALGILCGCAVVGSIWLLRESAIANARSRSLSDLRASSSQLFRLQLDEETGIRGYAADGDRVFLEPYYAAETKLAPLAAGIESALIADDETAADLALLRRAEVLHREWIDSVAHPTLVAGRYRDPSVAFTGKALMDELRGVMFRLDADLGSRAAGQRAVANRAFVSGAALGAAAIATAGGLTLVALMLLRTATEELTRERAITRVLQTAFIGSSESSPAFSFGSAYVSATKGAAVGGDLFDLHAIDHDRRLVLLADVSGKGIDAAVDTALIKFATRTLIRTNDDPAEIAGALNDLYQHERADSGSFVVLFLALLDVAHQQLRYVNAGLSSAYLARGNEVRTLDVTGPAVGIAPRANYETRRLDLVSGDRIILATDGLIEARAPAGEFIGEPRLESWIRSAKPKQSAQDVVDGLVRRLRSFTNNRLRDDLAVIALIARDQPAAEATTRPPRPPRSELS